MDKTQTGVGEWCAPGPAAEQRRRWMLVFEDQDHDYILYEDEMEARQAFAKAEGHGWNCHLFQHAPRAEIDMSDTCAPHDVPNFGGESHDTK